MPSSEADSGRALTKSFRALGKSDSEKSHRSTWATAPTIECVEFRKNPFRPDLKKRGPICAFENIGSDERHVSVYSDKIAYNSVGMQNEQGRRRKLDAVAY